MVLTSHYIRKSMSGENVTSFDIKVALLGHVSVGKTTLLNALLKDKYGEVSMRRTTAGINHFRVNHASVAPPAEHVLDEITEDNTILREETTIREKFFDVFLEEQFLDMREDTSLVIVDIPGLNEAGSRDMYLKYVKDSWDTFDCVIVVMDASLGVNSEEQVNLLRFVKEIMAEQKQVPVIVLCNKVDDPDDAEVVELVNEVEEKVAMMFPGYSASNKNKKEGTAGAGIAFIPMSAGNAYMYRSASRLPFQEFKRLDRRCIDKIGHEECGIFKWKRLSSEKQYELVYEVMNDPAKFDERLKACNFDTFLSTLEMFLGGKEVQEDLIVKQLEVLLSKLSHDKGFADKLCSIYDRSAALGREVSELNSTFWRLYGVSRRNAFSEFENDPRNVTNLGKLIDELSKYSKGLHAKLFRAEDMATTRKRDADRIVKNMKFLIKSFCSALVQKEAEWDFKIYFKHAFGFYGGHSYKDVTEKIPSLNWKWKSVRWYDTQNNWPAKGPSNENPRCWSWNHRGDNKWFHTQTGSTKWGTAELHPCIIIDQDRTSTTWEPLSSWKQLSPYDWHSILSSILLLKHQKHFYEHFAAQIAQLEWLGKTGKFNLKLNETEYCPSHGQCKSKCSCPWDDFETKLVVDYRKHLLSGKYFHGDFVPDDKDNYNRASQIDAPGSPEDVHHWGNLIWKFCEYMELQKEEAISNARI